MKTKPIVRYKHKTPICIYMPEVIPPDDRTEIFEKPLSRILSPRMARVDGGGTWLGAASDVWVYTSSLKYTLPLVRSFFLSRSAPDCTQVQYAINGIDYHDLLVDGEWENLIRSVGYHLGFSLAG